MEVNALEIFHGNSRHWHKFTRVRLDQKSIDFSRIEKMSTALKRSIRKPHLNVSAQIDPQKRNHSQIVDGTINKIIHW